MASSFPPSGNGEQHQHQMTTPSAVNSLNGPQSLPNARSGGLVHQSGTSTPISGGGAAGLVMGALTAEQLQQHQQQDLRALALQQQLAALMQQSQQQQPPGGHSAAAGLSAFLPLSQSAAPTPVAAQQCASATQPGLVQPSGAGGSALLSFYQQLLALQQQQQHNSPPTVAALPQQFSTALHLQNSPAASVLSQHLGGGAGTPTPSGTAPPGGTGPSAQSATSSLLGGLLASNPALLHNLLGQQQNPLLASLTAQLLLPQQQAPPPQAQQQSQAQLASLLQLLNPNAATMYAYQSYLQQQQQATTNNAAAQQLQLLVQLLANGGGGGNPAGGMMGGGGGLQTILAALNGGQQQALVAALAAQQQQQVSVQQAPPVQPASIVAPQQQQQQEEGRLLLEQLIRQSREQQQQKLQQQQQEQQQQLVGIRQQSFGGPIEPAQPSPSNSALAASVHQQQAQFGGQQEHQQQQQTVAELVAQQLAQQQQQQLAVAQQNQQQQQQQIHSAQINQQGEEPPNGGGGQQQQQSTERLLTSEAVQDRISRLISENEAIIEPNPVLLKRRPYQRQGTSNSMTSQTSENTGTSQRGSPGIRSPGIGTGGGIVPKMHPATTRSFSLHEASFLRLGGGSLTSGQPINRQQHNQQQQLTCNFCQLKFPNEAGLEAHESRCSKKEMLLQKQQSQPQLKIAAHHHHHHQQQQQIQMQLQQLQEHQSTIAALVGGGKGVARDLVINGGGGGGGEGRASVPAFAAAAPPNAAVALRAGLARQQLGQSSSDSRLKKRGLDQESGGSGSGTDSIEMIDVVSGGGGPDLQPGAESSNKMARIELAASTSTATQQQQPLAAANHAGGHPTTMDGANLADAQQQAAQPVLTMRDAIIFAITYSTDLRSTVKMPYFLTLTPAELDALAAGGQGEAGGGNFRGRTRNITSETFVCLNKVRPTPIEHRDNCSAYSAGWSMPDQCANVVEAQLVHLFLSACSASSARPRVDQLSGQYTLAASRESGQLRTTHSSFWSQQQHQKCRQPSGSPLIVGGEEKEEEAVLETAPEEEEESDADLPPSFHQIGAANERGQHDEIDGAAKNVVKMEVDDKENSDSEPRKEVVKEEKARKPRTKMELQRMPVSRSGRDEEMEVYIRGRGRGRYVCERCGIRCKKPSMLKKHLRSHTNVRPFTCLTCNFSFKTKGNLTKHLVSKAHKRRMMDIGGEEGSIRHEHAMREVDDGEEEDDDDDEGEGRLIVAEEEEEEGGGSHGTTTAQEQRRMMMALERQRLSHLGALDQKFMEGEFDRDEDDEDWDEEDADNSPEQEVPPPPPGTLTYRRFGQENILVERETHTPPTLWMLMCPEAAHASGGGGGGGDQDEGSKAAEPSDWGWPHPEDVDGQRGCHSAPPAALCSPDHSRTRRRKRAAEQMKKEAAEQQLKQETQQEMPAGAHEARQSQQQQQQPALANFIPQTMRPTESAQLVQQQFQQPSLAAQLAAGLLQAVPFHPHPHAIQQSAQSVQIPPNPSPSIGSIVGHQSAAQQLLFQLGEQQQQPCSAFAPPSGGLPLASALKLLEDQMHAGEQQGAGGAGNGMNAAANDSFVRAQSTLEAFLATEVQQFQCDMCDRKFRKDSELVLHKQAHLIERNARHKAAFQCMECPTVVRSKSMLIRHSESVHGRSGEEQQQQMASANNPPPIGIQMSPSSSAVASSIQSNGAGLLPVPPSSAAQMLPPPSASVPVHPSSSSHPNNHFRNFLCTDCNLGFRSHGVLAKHLRSKNHLKMLVSQGKLGEDANALLVRENSKALNSIDASNCETSLHSIKQLLGKMREQLGMMDSAMAMAANTANINGENGRQLAVGTSNDQLENGPSPPAQLPAKSATIGGTSVGGPSPRIISSMASGIHKRPMEPLPHGLKRMRREEPPMAPMPMATIATSSLSSGSEELAASGGGGTFHSPQQYHHHHQRRDSFSSPSPQRPKLSREDIIHQTESPLHSLAQVAVAAAAAAAAAASRQSASPRLHSPPLPPPPAPPHSQKTTTGATTFVANVWVPPKLDQLIHQEQGVDSRKSSTPELHNGTMMGAAAAGDRLNSLLSNRSAEETSESTGTRSESSTPVQRMNAAHHQQMAAAGFSPMSGATRCQLCELNFDSSADLAVHFHADHVLMRHGRDFRCSRRNCEKVFPSRDSLRAHIHAHFFGGVGADQSTNFAASCPASPSLLVRRPPAPSAPPPSAQSPGVPEESNSAISQLHPGQAPPQSLSSPPSVASNFGTITTPSKANRVGKGRMNGAMMEEKQQQRIINIDGAAPPNAAVSSLLCCQFCAEQLPDVQALQAHWVKQHMAQLTRPHVCVECDAGFTTEEALRAHREKQHSAGLGPQREIVAGMRTAMERR